MTRRKHTDDLQLLFNNIYVKSTVIIKAVSLPAFSLFCFSPFPHLKAKIPVGCIEEEVGVTKIGALGIGEKSIAWPGA